MSKKKCGNCKRPPNAFILFCRDTRPSLVQKFPKMPSSDVSSLLSQLWKSLDVITKQTYKNKAQNLLIIANKNRSFYENIPYSSMQPSDIPYSNSDSSQSDSDKMDVNQKHEACQYYPLLDPNELFYQIVPEKNFQDFQSIFENIVGENDYTPQIGTKI